MDSSYNPIRTRGNGESARINSTQTQPANQSGRPGQLFLPTSTFSPLTSSTTSPTRLRGRKEMMLFLSSLFAVCQPSCPYSGPSPCAPRSSSPTWQSRKPCTGWRRRSCCPDPPVAIWRSRFSSPREPLESSRLLRLRRQKYCRFRSYRCLT